MIPITVDKQVRQQVGKEAIPITMGAFETQQKRRTAGIVADGITDVGTELVKYAEKHKAQDVATDQAAFGLHYKNVMTDAEDQAQRTSNPDEVHGIYQRADKAISDYITGTNDDGTPNVRWKDHQDKVKLSMSEIKAQNYQHSQRRILNIYKADSVAKHQRLGEEFVESEDVEGLKTMGPVMRDSGLYTPEEVNKFLSGGERAIEQKIKAKPYNAMTKNLAELAYQVEVGDISTEQEIDILQGMQTQVENVHEDHQDILDKQIYSRLGKAYRTKKTELNHGFTQLAAQMKNGNYDEKNLEYFLSGRLGDYQDLVLAANEIEDVLGDYSGKSGDKASNVLGIVNGAISGDIPIGDAVKQLKAEESKLGPLGLIMLGASMMATDSGSDPEGIHQTWTAREDTFGWGNKPVKVAPDSILGYTVQKLGVYVIEDDEKAKWVEKTLFKAVDIQNDPEKSDAEKRTAVNELFKDRALDTMRPVKTSFDRESDIRAVMNANEGATRAQAEQYLKQIGR